MLRRSRIKVRAGGAEREGGRLRGGMRIGYHESGKQRTVLRDFPVRMPHKFKGRGGTTRFLREVLGRL
jgi:hypothetical protein